VTADEHPSAAVCTATLSFADCHKIVAVLLTIEGVRFE